MTPDLSVLVLAGGHALRLGGRKAERTVGGRRLVDGVFEVARQLSDDVLLLSRDRRLAAPGTRRIDDVHGVDGPLAGLAAGLAAARGPWSLLLACDMPHCSPRVVRRLLAAGCDPGVEAVVVHDGTRLQPFHGLYHRDLLARLQAYLARGGRSLMGVLEQSRRDSRLRAVPLALLGEDADGRFLTDVDTPAALRRLRRTLPRDATTERNSS